MPSIIEFKARFFSDLDKLQNAEERAAKQALSRFGAFVRTRARSSMRKRKKASAPGQPPSDHLGYLKKFLFFAYEPTAKSVVVGPALLGSKRKTAKTVPEIIEYGGEVEIRDSRLRIDGQPKRPRTANYPERPYMRPAFAAELPKAAPAFKNMIR